MTYIVQREDGITIETTDEGAWIRTTATGFTSKEDAVDWQLNFANSWPEFGYGTMFTVGEDKATNTYSVRAMRYSSCD